MVETTSIITGKITTTTPSPGNANVRRLYVKIFPGAFTMRPPRPKKAKILMGELLVRYSGREWPEKKNGPLVGDHGFLGGIANMLRDLNLEHADDITWSEEQHSIKETVTIRVGTKLAKEMLDRGMASLS
jgi:hypothetical protein